MDAWFNYYKKSLLILYYVKNTCKLAFYPYISRQSNIEVKEYKKSRFFNKNHLLLRFLSPNSVMVIISLFREHSKRITQ